MLRLTNDVLLGFGEEQSEVIARSMRSFQLSYVAVLAGKLCLEVANLVTQNPQQGKSSNGHEKHEDYHLRAHEVVRDQRTGAGVDELLKPPHLQLEERLVGR